MKNLGITILLVLLIGSSSMGQHRYIKLIEKAKYDKAERKISEDLTETPNDIGLNVAMGVLLQKMPYAGHSYEKSYQHLVKADSILHIITDAKELRKLAEDSISSHSVGCYLDTACSLALDQLGSKSTEETYNSYLHTFSKAPTRWIQKATLLRDSSAYIVAMQGNSIVSFDRFLTQYPSARQAVKARQQRNALAFECVRKADSINGYKRFIAQYPEAVEVKEAEERIQELAFNEAIRINTSAAYRYFCDEYPTSIQLEKVKYLQEHALMRENTVSGQWESYRQFIDQHPGSIATSTACDSIYSIGVRTQNLQAIKYYVDNIEGEKRPKALLLLHDLYTNDGERITLDQFYEMYDSEEPLEDIREKDYEIAAKGDLLHLEQPYSEQNADAYDEYIRLEAPRERAFVALQRMIAPDINAKRWTSALNKITHYAPFWSSKSKPIDDLATILRSKLDATIKVTSIGKGVNTVSGGEYVPVISADDKLLYFCGRGRAENIGGEDIFVSKKTKTGWGNAKIVEDLSSSLVNDAPLSISADGTTMLLFKSGMINKAEKQSKGWSEVTELPQAVNSASWQADAMISSDGKALIFASTREGGMNKVTNINELNGYHGDNVHPTDIYVSLLNEQGEWGEPINLGSTINTQFCDRSPFLHPDMKTLYFSSDGHGGLGKLDVFKSTRLADTCWTCWSEPVNMGKEINTEESDWGYRISTDGQKAYFSKSNSPAESEDIYWLNLPKYLQPNMVATITGTLVDKDNHPVSADIRWEDLETGKNVGQSKSDPVNGNFFIVLPLGKIYGYFVDKQEYFPISNSIDLRKGNKPVDIEEKIDMTTFKQMVEQGTAVPVNNLFFNFSESSLLPYSIPELKRVAKIIKANGLRVEVSGHTDNVGDNAKNQVLSEQRAVAVKDLLIKEGCNKDLIVTVGYGDTRPVASNTTEPGRSKNRRVELRFMK
jgi:outer membrane protein OmpA-like peptidoglycan-associated protein